MLSMSSAFSIVTRVPEKEKAFLSWFVAGDAMSSWGSNQSTAHLSRPGFFCAGPNKENVLQYRLDFFRGLYPLHRRQWFLIVRASSSAGDSFSQNGKKCTFEPNFILILI